MEAHKVTDFKKKEEADAFLDKLRAGIQKRQKDFESGRFVTFGPAKVVVSSLDVKGAAAFAEARKSVARPTEVTLFLNEGAWIACQELGIELLDLDAIDKTVPDQAKEVVNESFRTLSPYASNPSS